jgi:hypothetical protein
MPAARKNFWRVRSVGVTVPTSSTIDRHFQFKRSALFFESDDVIFRENQVFWDVMLRLQNNFTPFERLQGLRLQGLQPFFRLPGRVFP